MSVPGVRRYGEHEGEGLRRFSQSQAQGEGGTGNSPVKEFFAVGSGDPGALKVKRVGECLPVPALQQTEVGT